MATALDRVLASPSTGYLPWHQMVREAWGAPSPPPELLARFGAAVEPWPADSRHVDPEVWDRVRASDAPPWWWPWARSLVLRRGGTLAPTRLLSGIVRLVAEGEYEEEHELRGYSVEGDLIGELASLREVCLQGNPSVSWLEPARLPASVIELDLSGGYVGWALGWSVRDIAALPALERLNLAGIMLDSLEGIGSMARLEELDLSGCTSLRSLDPLRPLGLRRLSLASYWGCPLEPLASLLALEELDLGGSYAPVDLSTVARLPSLRRLEIGGQGVMSLAPFAHGRRSLRSLSLEQAMCLEALDGLEGLTSLDELAVENAPRLASLRPLDRLPGLRALRLRDVGAWHGVESIAACRDLGALALVDGSSGGSLRSVDFLGALTELRELTLELPALESLPDLSGMTALRSLYLRCPRLRSVSALRGLPALARLTLDDCEDVRDVASLADMPSLSDLRLHGRTPPAGRPGRAPDEV